MVEHKEAGNSLFKEQKWAEAAEAYSKGIENSDLANDVRGLLLSNRSQCNLNLEHWQQAFDDADACLQLLPSHTKSIFRRAVALEHLGKAAEAAADFIKVVKMEPGNKLAAEGARRLRTQVLDAKDKRMEAALPANVLRLLSADSSGCSTDEQKLEACSRLKQCAYHGRAEALLSAGVLKQLLQLSTAPETSREVRAAALSGLVALASGREVSDDDDEEEALLQQTSANANEPLPLTTAAAEARQKLREELAVPEMMRLCHGHAASMAQHALLLGHVFEPEDVDALTAIKDAMASGLEGEEVDAPRAGILALVRLLDTRRRQGKFGKPVVATTLLHQCLESAMNVTSCPDLLKTLLATVFALLGDDDRPKDAEVNLEQEALKVLEPFLQSGDRQLRANGLHGLSVLFEAAPKIASKLLHNSAVPLMAVIGSLTQGGGAAAEAGGSVEEDAANCLLYAASEQETRLHLIQSGTIEMLISLSTEDGGAPRNIRAKLIGVLAVLASHSKEVREEVFDRVDFLMELSYAMTVARDMKQEANKAGKIAKGGGSAASQARARDAQRLARGLYESCACLSIHGEFKEMLIGSKKTLRAIQDLVAAEDLAEDPTMAFSYVSLIYNFCLSREDKIRPKSTQYPMSELADDDLTALEEAMEKLPPEMRKAKNGDVDAGSPELARQLRTWCVLLSEDASKRAGDKSSHASPVIVNLCKCIQKGTPGLRNLIAHIFKFICKTQEHRSYLVSSGAVRALLKLVDLEDEKARDAARQSLAQICIVTNPALLQYSEQLDAVRPLAEMLEHKHELMQFEAAMGLTNLLIVSEELRSRAVQAEAWRRARDLLFSENEMVQRAGLETMCNLCMAPEVIERFVEGKAEIEIKCFIAFTGAEDLAAQNASSGALAMLSDYPEVAEKIAASENFPNFLEILQSPGLDAGVQHRIAVCLSNLCQATEHVPQNVRQLALSSLKKRDTGAGFQSSEAAALVRELANTA
mmetsp:Transcript_27350/g.63783  ORF Transcript_27350/g.63783 Transcript_27350/m.63783 type:complete len:984 (-) Transcript_27350:61-3012(-)